MSVSKKSLEGKRLSGLGKQTFLYLNCINFSQDVLLCLYISSLSVPFSKTIRNRKFTTPAIFFQPFKKLIRLVYSLQDYQIGTMHATTTISQSFLAKSQKYINQHYLKSKRSTQHFDFALVCFDLDLHFESYSSFHSFCFVQFECRYWDCSVGILMPSQVMT